MQNLPFSYSIRRSTRTKNVRLVVTFNKVEVVAPLQVSESRILRFVQSKQDWVLAALAKIAIKNQAAEIPPLIFTDGVAIPYQGYNYLLSLQTTNLKRIKITFDKQFIAHIPQTLSAEEQPNALKNALIVWIKKQAKQQVEEIIKQHSPRYGLLPRSLTIKRQKSRWGSCGIHDDIHINWLLMSAPPSVLEYVVVHELCHLKVRNHSSDFWNLVAQHLPDYQKQRQWLKKHGAILMRNWQ